MQIEVNPQNSQKLEPAKFSCYTVDTFIDTNFPFERILLFVTKDARISRLFHDAAFRCQMVKNVTEFLRFCYLNIP